MQLWRMRILNRDLFVNLTRPKFNPFRPWIYLVIAWAGVQIHLQAIAVQFVMNMVKRLAGFGGF